MSITLKSLEKFKGMKVVHQSEYCDGNGFVLKDKEGNLYFYDDEEKEYYALKDMDKETYEEFIVNFPDCALEMGVDLEEILWLSITDYTNISPVDAAYNHPLYLWCQWVERDSLTWKEFVEQFDENDLYTSGWMDKYFGSPVDYVEFAKEFVHPEEREDYLKFVMENVHD